MLEATSVVTDVDTLDLARRSEEDSPSFEENRAALQSHNGPQTTTQVAATGSAARTLCGGKRPRHDKAGGSELWSCSACKTSKPLGTSGTSSATPVPDEPMSTNMPLHEASVDLRLAVAALQATVATKTSHADGLCSVLHDVASQLDTALELVATIPALHSRQTELEALVDELQLLKDCAEGGKALESRACIVLHVAPEGDNGASSAGIDPACEMSAGEATDVLVSSDLSSSTLRSRLASSERELLHQKQLCDELLLQVRGGCRVCGASLACCKWVCHPGSFLIAVIMPVPRV
jgi:hypothetical protein